MPDGLLFRPIDTPPRRGRGQPAFVPTNSQRDLVTVMRANGNPVWLIARAIGISQPTLRKNFRDELKHGFDDIVARIGLAMVKAALNGNVGAQMRWLAVHCPEWRIPKAKADHDVTVPPDVQEVVHFFLPIGTPR